VWSDDTVSAFQQLKKAFIKAPVLLHFDSNKPIQLEMNASSFALVGILCQPAKVPLGSKGGD
jgi:hypothetical protein